MTNLRIVQLSKYFGETVAVDNLDLEINDKEFVVFLGPSGCGKTTLLRMIAGLLKPTSGAIFFDDKDVINLTPKERNIAMVFQEYSLYPHMSVRKNMSLCLKVDKVPSDEIEERVIETAQLLEIEEQLEKKPGQLSGGQQQRVALGRAIIRKPSIFLMDEPLSNLDAILRMKMRVELKKLQKNLETTTIFVTHDQSEAMMLADNILVICNGTKIQYGKPREIYDHPETKFVAEFIGSPSMNFLDCVLTKANGDYLLDAGKIGVPLSNEMVSHIKKESTSDDFVVGVRPHHVQISSQPQPGYYELKDIISQLMGKVSYITVELQNNPFTIEITAAMHGKIKDRVYVSIDPNQIYVFDKKTDKTVLG